MRYLSFAFSSYVTILLFMLILALAGITYEPPIPAKSDRIVIDESDRAVALPPTIGVQAVFMGIGAGTYLLTTRHPSELLTSDSSENQRLRGSSYLARALPALSDMRLLLKTSEDGPINAEFLLKEQPSVLVTWARLAPEFRRVGLNVAGLMPIDSTVRIAQNTYLFTDIVNEHERADAMITRSLAARDIIAADVASQVHSKTKALFLIPRQEGIWLIQHKFADLLDQAGGEDLAARLQGRRPINIETLLLLHSEVIILVGNTSDSSAAPERMLSTSVLSSVPAVQSRRIYHEPPGLSGFMESTIEMPLYLRWLAEILHPLELHSEARDLASRILENEFGVAPTSKELDQLFARSLNRYSAFQ